MVDKTFKKETVTLEISHCIETKLICDTCKQVKTHSHDGAIQYYHVSFWRHNEDRLDETYDFCCQDCVAKWIEKNLDNTDANSVRIWKDYLSAI